MEKRTVVVLAALLPALWMAFMQPDFTLDDWGVYVDAGTRRARGEPLYIGPTGDGGAFLAPPWIAAVFSAWAHLSPWATYALFALPSLVLIAHLAARNAGPAFTTPRAALLGLSLSPGLWLGQISPILMALALAGQRDSLGGTLAITLAVLLKPTWFVPLGALLLATGRHSAFLIVGLWLTALLFFEADQLPAWSRSVNEFWVFLSNAPGANLQFGTIRWIGNPWLRAALVLVAWAFAAGSSLRRLPLATRWQVLPVGVLAMPWLIFYDLSALVVLGLVLRWADGALDSAACTEPRRAEPSYAAEQEAPRSAQRGSDRVGSL